MNNDRRKVATSGASRMGYPPPPIEELNVYLNYALEAKGTIFEPLCGTGRFLIPLLEKGYSIDGSDPSPLLLNICKKKCLEKGLVTSLLEGSFEDMVVQDFYKLVIMPESVFCSLSPEEAILAIKFIASHLQRGGKFIFDVKTQHFPRSQEGIWKGRWLKKEDGSLVVIDELSSYSLKPLIEHRLVRATLWAPGTPRVEFEEVSLRYYEEEELRTLLETNGLKILETWTLSSEGNKEKKMTGAPIIFFECTS